MWKSCSHGSRKRRRQGNELDGSDDSVYKKRVRCNLRGVSVVSYTKRLITASTAKVQLAPLPPTWKIALRIMLMILTGAGMYGTYGFDLWASDLFFVLFVVCFVWAVSQFFLFGNEKIDEAQGDPLRFFLSVSQQKTAFRRSFVFNGWDFTCVKQSLRRRHCAERSHSARIRGSGLHGLR